MIKIILRLLTKKEKNYFNFIFLLLCINSIFELFSLAIFYPTLTLLFDEDYNFEKIDNFLNYFNYQITSFEGYLYLFLITILIIFFVKNLFNFYFLYHQNKFVQIIRLRSSNQLINKYMYLPYNYFFKKTLPTILRNIDLATSFSMIVVSLIMFFSEILILFLLILFLLSVEFNLTIIIVIISLMIIYLSKRISNKKFYSLGVKSQKFAKLFKKEILQTFSGIREIKILKKESFFSKKFTHANKLEAHNNFMRDLLIQLPRIIIELLIVCSIVLMIFVMFKLEYEKSEMIIYISLVVLTSVRLMPSSVRIVSSIQRLKYSEPLNKILIKEFDNSINSETYSDTYEEDLKNELLPFNNQINFKDVSFGYHIKKPVIKNFNLKIKKNSCIGIFGESGSGKSTITDLIMGLLEPTAGKITIDDKNLTENIHLWQNNISYVSQQPFFLNDSLTKNIAFGLPNNKIDKKMIIQSAKKAQIFEFINKLKNKFNTRVGENGINFSGGQLQRIAIARALYRKSKILILDEATNALDSESEKLFFKFLRTLKKKLTIIIISHKSENLNICDQVVKINKM